MAWNEITLNNVQAALNDYNKNKSCIESVFFCACAQDPFIRALQAFEDSLSNTDEAGTLESNDCVRLAQLLVNPDAAPRSQAATAARQSLVKLYSAEHFALFQEFWNQPVDVFFHIVFNRHDKLNAVRDVITKARQADEGLAQVVGRAAQRQARERTSGADQYEALPTDNRSPFI